MGGMNQASSRIPRESATAAALSKTTWKGHGVNARPDPPRGSYPAGQPRHRRGAGASARTEPHRYPRHTPWSIS
jgi:hypothetical protein